MNPTKDPSLRTKLDPKKAVTLLLLAFQSVVGIILLCQRGCPPPLPPKLGDEQFSRVSNSEFLFVHVVGNVKSPGVYKFPANSSPTRTDVVAAAGGFINPSSPTDLSVPVKDEEQVFIE